MELQLSRDFAAGRERVFAAWTDPAQLGQWFWPASFETEYSVDLQVGGKFRYSAPKMGMGVSGVFQEIAAPDRLVYTWIWDEDDHETLVTIEFATVAGGTRVSLLHERFETEADRDQHAQGWNDCIDRLVGLAPVS